MNKATQKTMFSSDKSCWETPPDLFKLVKTIFNIGFDAAASDTNHLTSVYLTEKDDSLQKVSWENLIFSKYNLRPISEVRLHSYWLNPPYGRGIIKWVKQAIWQYENFGLETLLLLPARTDTKWFELLAKKCSLIYFLRGRLIFNLNGKPIIDEKGKIQPAPFPSALYWLGNDALKYDEELREKCTLFLHNKD